MYSNQDQITDQISNQYQRFDKSNKSNFKKYFKSTQLVNKRDNSMSSEEFSANSSCKKKSEKLFDNVAERISNNKWTKPQLDANNNKLHS